MIQARARAMPAHQESRAQSWLSKIPQLRETLYLFLELRTLLFSYRPGKARAENARDYESKVDPWGYSTRWGAEHLRVLQKMLNASAGATRFRRVLDVGCGEGWVSQALANRCDSLVGVDVVPIALSRAEDRCRSLPHVRFQNWDLQTDPPLGEFELILVMGVLENFSLNRELLTVRRKIIEMLEPGGIVLVTTARQTEAFDDAWWGRWLPRGGPQISRFLARDPRLRICQTVVTKTHHFSVYRRRHAA